MALPLSKRLEGKYEILERLHEGGMGAIYKVRHRLLGEVRVIKVIRGKHQLDQDIRDRFIDEAKTAARLRHPNIAQLHDFSIAEDGTAYQVLEFIEGVNLEELLRAKGPQAVSLVIEIAIQALRALDYIHRSFVHRDISPDNLMLTQDADDQPLVKLIDLGIAKPLSTEIGFQRAVEKTRRGTFLGKAFYSAPEQLQDVSNIDARSDLYSLGIVLYELLTNVFPIEGTDMRSLLVGHIFRPPIPFEISDPEGRVPNELRQIVNKAMEKGPDDRFASAKEFGHELGRLAGSLRRTTGSSPKEELTRTLAGLDLTEAIDRSPGSTQRQLDDVFDLGPTPPPDSGEKDSPEDQQVAVLLAGAVVLAKADHFDQAHAQLRQVLRLNPTHTEAQQLLQQVEAKRLTIELERLRERVDGLLEEGDLAQAEEVLERARKEHGERDLIEQLRSRLAELKASQEAQELADQTRESERGLRQAASEAKLAIRNQLEAGQLEAARRDLDRAVETFGEIENFSGLEVRLVQFEETKQREEKIARVASKIGRELARRTEETKRQQQIQTLIDEAIELTREQKLEAAIIRLDQVTELDPENARARQLRQEIGQQQRQQAAAAQAKRAIETELENGRLKEARRALPKAVRAFGEIEDFGPLERRLAELEADQKAQAAIAGVANRLVGLLERGSLDKASRLLAESIAEHGEAGLLVELRERLDQARAELRERERREEEARRQEEVQRRLQRTEALMDEARSLAGQGQLEAALKRLEQALELDPDNATVRQLQEQVGEQQQLHIAVDEVRDTIESALRAGHHVKARKALQGALDAYGSVADLSDLERRVVELEAARKRERAIVRASKLVNAEIDRGALTDAAGILSASVEEHGDNESFTAVRKRLEATLREQERQRQEERRAEAADAAVARIEALIAEGRITEAEGELAAAIQDVGERDPLLRARQLIEAGKKTKLEERLQLLLELAAGFEEAEDFTDALATLKRAIDLGAGSQDSIAAARQRIEGKLRQQERRAEIASSRAAIEEMLRSGQLRRASRAVDDVVQRLGETAELEDLRQAVTDELEERRQARERVRVERRERWRARARGAAEAVKRRWR